MSTPSPLLPEDQALFDIRTLLIAAYSDGAFRDALIKDPAAAAATKQITLRKVDEAHLKLVADTLQRFSTTNTAVHYDDVVSWATGVLLRTFTCPVAFERWDIHTFSIQRFAFACATPVNAPFPAPDSTVERSTP